MIFPGFQLSRTGDRRRGPTGKFSRGFASTGLLLAVLVAWIAAAARAQPDHAAPSRAGEPPRLLSVRDFAREAAAPDANDPVRVRGTVTAVTESRVLFLQDLTGGLLVLHDGAGDPPRVGDAVEVLGRAGTEGGHPCLVEARVRTLGPGTLPPPPLATVADLAAGRFDAQLVRVDARLAAVRDPPRTGVRRGVYLSAGGRSFYADLNSNLLPELDRGSFPPLRPGQLLRVTGVCSLIPAGERASPAGFRLLLRSKEDVTILGPPPWWLPPRIYPLAAAAAAVAAAIVGWLLALRRQVRQQTTQVRARYAGQIAAESRYRELMENAADLILAVDAAGRVTDFNPAGERLLGYRAEELLGKDARRLLTPEHAATASGFACLHGMMERAAQEGQTFLQFDLVARDGRRVPFEFSAWLAGSPEAPTGLQTIGRDLTERRRSEAERARLERKLQEGQRLESLGVLAGGIAHDFNNLLMGVLGNADLARNRLPPLSPAAPCLKAIESAAERAAELCGQMLAYAGRGRFVVREVNLTELAEDTLPLLRSTCRAGAELRLDLSRPLPAVRGDATQLRQIIMNLVINGFESLGPGGGAVTVRTGALPADPAELAAAHGSPGAEGWTAAEAVFLEVGDSGTGMDEGTLARIFDPFFTTKFTGRGLGLAAVLGIVRGHGGALRVTSRPGEGTVFRLLLPSLGRPATTATATAAATATPPPRQAAGPNGDVAAPGPEPGPGELQQPPTAARRGAPHVLVVDDERPLRELLGDALTQLGYAVALAADGPEAVQKLREAPEGARIQAVLLDLTLPQMGGVEIFRELRRLSPDLPVLMMSGYGEAEALAPLADEGVADFVQKPFQLQTMHEKLAAILKG